MFDYLEGRVAERRLTRLVLDVGGVGYDLAVPIQVDLGAPGERARVFTHLVVREDAHLLFGFPDRGLRDLFRALLTVRGVGPSVALSILSGIERGALLAALSDGDPAPLQRIKGVGPKTAQQILLDLRGRAGDLLAAAGGGPELPGKGASAAVEDAVAALVSIGYAEREARKSVARASSAVGAADVELLVRTALSP